MSGRILVIRGGAIGDFILTLPALALLRDAFPEAYIEILGYRHIISLAEKRFYADATRSIEYGPLSGFFNPKSDLDPALCEYFASFHQVISYLYDPDGFFTGNLARAGVRNLISADPRIQNHAHASQQLALPLQKLALFLADDSAGIFPATEDFDSARQALPNGPVIAVHPGSGGSRKNWPLSRWIELIGKLLESAPKCHIAVVGGESDVDRMAALREAFSDPRIRFLDSLPLPTLGAVFAKACLFIGHDSGISHLAAAAGCRCVLLFGPTDPTVWAPTHSAVTILQSPTDSMDDIPLASVIEVVDPLLANV